MEQERTPHERWGEFGGWCALITLFGRVIRDGGRKTGDLKSKFEAGRLVVVLRWIGGLVPLGRGWNSTKNLGSKE